MVVLLFKKDSKSLLDCRIFNGTLSLNSKFNLCIFLCEDFDRDLHEALCLKVCSFLILCANTFVLLVNC